MTAMYREMSADSVSRLRRNPSRERAARVFPCQRFMSRRKDPAAKRFSLRR
jgi:hypothetical protein